jgi:hypothetical protein
MMATTGFSGATGAPGSPGSPPGSPRSRIHIIQPAERVKRFGIECVGPAGDGILFRAGEWKPGGEYIQKLIIRNVSTTVKKLKYKLPATRYFSMAYPEVIVLSPGMFQEIDVVFRPVEYAPYDDSIYMKMQDGPGSGGFHVPCGATIEKLILSTPFGVDLGWCPAYQTTATTFKLANTGEIDAPFRWEECPPFILEPSSGVIPMGKSIDVRVSIYPTDASVFVAQATCVVGEGADALIPEPIISSKISAICKHAYIVLSEEEINFGEVFSGTPADATTREVELRNNGVVPAEFELIRHESDKDEVFDITPRKGVIEAMSELSVKVKFHALAMGIQSLDRYTFKTPGGALTTLTCKGVSMPPKITLFKEMRSIGATASVDEYPEGSPANSVNFRDIELGKKESRLLFLKNDSNKASSFSIVADYAGVFQIEPQQGIIPALTQYCPIKIVFSPKEPINYYRRMFVLISDSQPLFFDIMGSGFIRAKGEIKEQRPAPIRHAHVQAYRNRLIDGIADLNPDQLDEINRENLGKREYFAQIGMQGTTTMAVSALKFPLTRTGETSRVAVAPAHEFFISLTDQGSNVVAVNRTMLDFGYTQYMSTSEPLAVNITNNTKGKVSVMWSMPRVHGDDRIDKDNGESKVGNEATRRLDAAEVISDPLAPVFHAEPFNVDINPGKTQQFKIYFKPKQSNRNYFSEIEAYVYFKNQRTFRLVDDATLTPPWCLPINCIGHTFGTGQLLAKGRMHGGSIRNGKLVFSNCYVNDAIYETIILTNSSNMPCVFQFKLGFDGRENDAGFDKPGTRGGRNDNNVFSVKPECGEIAAGGFVLVCVRFAPSETRKRYVQLLRCIINGDDGGKLLLEGIGDRPFVSCPELSHIRVPSYEDEFIGKAGLAQKNPIPDGFQGSLYMTPTCVGLSTTKTFIIKNSSRLPVRFVITLPPEAAGVLDIVPLKAILKGNEDLKLTVIFAPQVAIRYEFKIKIKTYPVGGVAPRILDARQIGIPDAPECLQSLRVLVIAPSSVGAVLFDPPRLTAEVRLVNTFEMKDIFIENVSDSDIQYSLLYATEFVPDTGSIYLPPPIVTKARPIYRNRGEAKNLGQDNDAELDHSLFCAYPSGVLPARSRKCITFTFYPTNAGLYEFLIHPTLIAIDRNTGKAVELSNDESALLRVSQADREERMVSATNRDDELFDEYSGESKLRNVPLMANITARAAFPTMVFEDIRTAEDMLVSDVEHLWQRFNFRTLNYDLSIPPTLEELKLYAESSPDLTKLHRYGFEFTPAVIGSPVQTVYIQVRNNGFLPTTFHCHLPNEKELDLEQWCDEDEPSEELNQVICIIEELKVFSFEPKEAMLQPGETVTLTLSYSHNYLKYNGLHRIPVMVTVDQGKMFYIDLVGRTLPPPANAQSMVSLFPSIDNVSSPMGLPTPMAGGTGGGGVGSAHGHPPPSAAVPHTGNIAASSLTIGSLATGSQHASNVIGPPNLVLYCPSADSNSSITEMSPVPIGLSHADAPLQRTEIVNVSGVDANYEIDTDPFFTLAQTNCEQPIIRIANPRGVVLARSSVYIEWYFLPVEAKMYEFTLTVNYTPIQTSTSNANFDSVESMLAPSRNQSPSRHRDTAMSRQSTAPDTAAGGGALAAMKKKKHMRKVSSLSKQQVMSCCCIIVSV